LELVGQPVKQPSLATKAAIGERSDPSGGQSRFTIFSGALGDERINHELAILSFSCGRSPIP
jgi:hypothetical protein